MDGLPELELPRHVEILLLKQRVGPQGYWLFEKIRLKRGETLPLNFRDFSNQISCKKG